MKTNHDDKTGKEESTTDKDKQKNLEFIDKQILKILIQAKELEEQGKRKMKPNEKIQYDYLVDKYIGLVEK